MSLSGVYRCLQRMVGARGFEPPASWSRTRRSSQAEPRPEVSSVERIGGAAQAVEADSWRTTRGMWLGILEDSSLNGKEELHDFSNTTAPGHGGQVQ
jgi:hypothetical protein